MGGNHMNDHFRKQKWSDEWSRELNPLPELPVAYEPKIGNRFIIKFPEELQIPSWVVNKTTRPSIKIKNIKLFGITLITWKVVNEITIVFLDPIGPSISQQLIKLVEENREFNYTLELLNETGIAVEKWQINRCSILSADFGRLSYDEDAIVKCYLTFKPKDVKLDY